MSLPRYSSYKDSGVEWLGDVPSHWRVDRLKASIISCRNGIWGDEAKGDEFDIPCVRVADFDRTRLRVELNEPTIRNVTDKERADRLLSRGNLLLEKSGGGETQPVGCVVIYDDDRSAICSNFVARVVLNANANPSFWRYVHAAAYNIRLTIGSINQTSGIQNLDQDRYFNERAAFPPPEEQAAIADFLDRETGKIDALVAEQERLIALLTEKRQAVISHAVTKGLNPTAPMKPSGIDWLGDIPAHWKLIALKHIVSMRSGEQITADTIDEEGDYPVYGGNGLRGYTSAFTHEGEYPLIGRQGALCGNINYAAGKFWASEHAVVVSPRQDYCVRWLGELLRAMNLGQYSVTAAQPGLSVEVIGNLTIPLPDINEQKAIASYLEREMLLIDQLRDVAEKSMSILQERRTALISAAVTGKIDVRDQARKEKAA